MSGEIRVGTSGWHYAHWRGPFYREMSATGLGARLQHERERLAQEMAARLERALLAMQGERHYLAGLLAELGLHLIRHAASPAAVAQLPARHSMGVCCSGDGPWPAALPMSARALAVGHSARAGTDSQLAR